MATAPRAVARDGRGATRKSVATKNLVGTRNLVGTKNLVVTRNLVAEYPLGAVFLMPILSHYCADIATVTPHRKAGTAVLWRVNGDSVAHGDSVGIIATVQDHP